MLKKKIRKEPYEISLLFLQQVIKENNISYTDLDILNIRNALIDLEKLRPAVEKSVKEEYMHPYSLYVYLLAYYIGGNTIKKVFKKLIMKKK